MSLVITQTQTTDTFQFWLDMTNLTANAFSFAVTVNNHANGMLTTGNGFVEGTFGARNLTANTLRGGTVETPGVLHLSSNLNVNVSSKVICGDISINSTDVSINGISLAPAGLLARVNTTTTGVSAQQIDFWDKLTYRGADYTITIKDNDANAYQISKLITVHDSGNGHITEYGLVFSNVVLGTFTCNANSTHIRFFVTPTAVNTYVSGTRLTMPG